MNDILIVDTLQWNSFIMQWTFSPGDLNEILRVVDFPDAFDDESHACEVCELCNMVHIKLTVLVACFHAVEDVEIDSEACEIAVDGWYEFLAHPRDVIDVFALTVSLELAMSTFRHVEEVALEVDVNQG